MTNLLVVDDSKVDRQLVCSLLEKRADTQVRTAENGREALDMIAKEPPDLVLTDLMMPEIDGLELVETVRREHPSLPVILMTAHGSEETAAEALRRGATSYVPKRYVARDLLETVENILAVAVAKREEDMVFECLAESQHRFMLDADPARFRPLIGLLKYQATKRGICPEADLMHVAVALDEALANALHHGNLEVESDMRETDMGAYFALIEERRTKSPWRDRRIEVTVRVTREEATYVIRDEGRGFDPTQLPDPTDPSNLEKASGRGLLLIRTFMDEVRHNESGNEITMIKRRAT